MMETVPLWVILSLGAILFFIGMIGLVLRRNILVILMCIELMLAAVNLTYVAFSRSLQNVGGELSVFFIITVAAAESAVGLGLLIAMFRTLRTVDTDDLRVLKE
jgi:NADH-quinone oxidoreductase subunit K